MPVFVRLCLSLLRCACPYWAVPVFVTLCLSLLGCACLCSAVPVFVTLCLSILGCACLCYAVPIFIGLCLSLLGCACLCYAVPNRVQLCWPLRVPLLFRNRIMTLILLYTRLSNVNNSLSREQDDRFDETRARKFKSTSGPLKCSHRSDEKRQG